jgi:hypothetical protein
VQGGGGSPDVQGGADTQVCMLSVWAGGMGSNAW